jgi:LysR substrate binding domain-containing protein
VTTAGEYLVPQLIQAFRERHRELHVSLDVGNREVVFRRVLDHKVDVAVTGRIPDDDRLVGRDFADNGLLETISPRGGLPRRRWHVVRSAIGPVREDAEAFMAFCDSPAGRRALAPRPL